MGERGRPLLRGAEPTAAAAATWGGDCLRGAKTSPERWLCPTSREPRSRKAGARRGPSPAAGQPLHPATCCATARARLHPPPRGLLGSGSPSRGSTPAPSGPPARRHTPLPGTTGPPCSGLPRGTPSASPAGAGRRAGPSLAAAALPTWSRFSSLPLSSVSESIRTRPFRFFTMAELARLLLPHGGPRGADGAAVRAAGPSPSQPPASQPASPGHKGHRACAMGRPACRGGAVTVT